MAVKNDSSVKFESPRKAFLLKTAEQNQAPHSNPFCKLCKRSFIMLPSYPFFYHYPMAEQGEFSGIIGDKSVTSNVAGIIL